MCMHAQLLSRVQLFTTPRTIAHQAPLSMVFSRQEYWRGFPYPTLGDLPHPRISNPCFLHLLPWQMDSLPLAPPGKLASKYGELKFTIEALLLSVTLNYENHASAFQHVWYSIGRNWLSLSVCMSQCLASLCYPPLPLWRPQILCLFSNNGTPLQYSCLENPMDGGAWWAAIHGVAKSRTRLSDSTFTFRFHTLEKEMATHSSVLAWRIPGTGEPGGLLSLGSHRVRHD